MRAELECVRRRLCDGGFTCVVLTNDGEYTSYDRGVKPLLELLDSKRSCSGAIAADKTVGAGAAHLYVLLGVRRLWANVISKSAITVLKDNGIDVCYGECVPYIINRKGDGRCPIECAVDGIKSSEEARSAIVSVLSTLSQKQ